MQILKNMFSVKNGMYNVLFSFRGLYKRNWIHGYKTLKLHFQLHFDFFEIDVMDENILNKFIFKLAIK